MCLPGIEVLLAGNCTKTGFVSDRLESFPAIHRAAWLQPSSNDFGSALRDPAPTPEALEFLLLLLLLLVVGVLIPCAILLGSLADLLEHLRVTGLRDLLAQANNLDDEPPVVAVVEH